MRLFRGGGCGGRSKYKQIIHVMHTSVCVNTYVGSEVKYYTFLAYLIELEQWFYSCLQAPLSPENIIICHEDGLMEYNNF